MTKSLLDDQFRRVERLHHATWVDDRKLADDIAVQWTQLACAPMLSPHSAISGMAYMAKRDGLLVAATDYARVSVLEDLRVPAGNHSIDPVTGFRSSATVHFPEMQCSLTTDSLIVVPPAHCLEEDWYAAGMEFQRIHPNGPLWRLLRHPIRDRIDMELTMQATQWRLYPALEMTHDERCQTCATLETLQEGFIKSHAHPPNLAALWRQERRQRKEAQSESHLEWIRQLASLCSQIGPEPDLVQAPHRS